MSEPQTTDHDFYSRIGHIAGVLGSDEFPAGERAALRRMNVARPPMAFYRFALRHLPDGWERQWKDWAAIVAGVALMAPNAHDPENRLGAVLADAGFSEARLERLLAAEGETRRTLLLRAARFLASRARPCNWVEGAQLLLTRDEEKREALHRRIGSRFYSTIDQPKTA